jgi:tetratricopeptide (TPR) repeat protein
MGGDLVQFGQAFRFLLKYGYLKIKNQYPLILTDNQWYVWHLKEEIKLTFVDIAYARNSSVRAVRSIYQSADDRIKQILDFAVYGGHYQLVAAHAMKKRGVLIQTVGDSIIEPDLDKYTAEELLLKEMTIVSEEEHSTPREWSIKAAYKTETFSGGRYLWKEWLGSLKNNNLLMMENYELPIEETYLREALGFRGYFSPDVFDNFKKLVTLFKQVPEELIKVGETAYFIGNIDSIYSSQFWNISSFIEDSDIPKWRKQFIKLAIKAFEAVLKKYTIGKFPLQHARTQNDLANFYSSLAEIENKVENCKRAITAYKEALRVFSANLFMFEYSLVNYNLGLAYQTLAELEETEVNSKLAIFTYKEAIKGRDLTNYPFEHAVTLVNQAYAYQTLANIEDNEIYSTFAIDSYNGALRSGSLDKMPIESAMIYSNIGFSYRTLAGVQETEHNCKQATLVLNDAITVRNQAQLPFEYAVTTTILGDVYSILATLSNKQENCQFAISAYDKATKIFIKKHDDFYEEVVKKKKQIVKFSKEES